MEIISFRETELNDKLMNLTVFQEKKELVENINLKTTLFQSLFILKQLSFEIIHFHQIQRTIKELKKFCSSFCKVIHFNTSTMYLYEEIKSKLINKIIHQCVSIMFKLIQNECQEFIISSGISFPDINTLRIYVQQLLELGILYYKMNDKFLLIDDLLIFLFDLIVAQFMKDEEFRIHFSIYLSKTLEVFILIFNKELKNNFKSFLISPYIFGNKTKLKRLIFSRILNVNVSLFPFIQRYISHPNKFNFFIALEVQYIYNMNRKTALEILIFYYEEIVSNSFFEFKKFQKDFYGNDEIKVEIFIHFLEILLFKFKEIISKSNSFRDNTIKLYDLIYIYSFIIYILKKLEGISRIIKSIIKTNQHLSSILIRLKLIKRELKLNITDFLLLYCSMVKKIRKILGSSSLQTCNSLINSIENLDTFTDRYLGLFYVQIKEVLNNLSTNKKINKLFKKNSIINNIFCISIEEHTKAFYFLDVNLQKSKKTKTNKLHIEWLNCVDQMIILIENDFSIKINKFEIDSLKELLPNHENNTKYDNLTNKLSIKSY